MEAQENYCQKDINHIKVLCRLNIVYIVIICLIISVCTLCIIPKCVSEYAFQNFSFASTICPLYWLLCPLYIHYGRARSQTISILVCQT